METVSRIATFVVFGAVVLGSIVCVTDSSAACPNWPGCYTDQFAPEFQLHPMIEFVHRVFSMATAPVVLLTAILVRRHSRPLVRWLPWVSLVGALGAGVFGMLTIKRGLSAAEGMIDLWCALLALTAISITTMILRSTDTAAETSVVDRKDRSVWYASTIIGLFVLHGTGVLVAGPGSFTRCLGWPLGYNSTADESFGVQIFRIIVAVSLFAVIFFVLDSRPLKIALIVECVLGAILLAGGLNDVVGSLFSAVAAGIVLVTALEWGRSLAVKERCC